MRVAITNTVALNGGDAAIAFAIEDALRGAVPDVDIELHDARPEVAARHYPDRRWRRGGEALLAAGPPDRPLHRAVRALDEARLLAAARALRAPGRRREVAALLLRPAERRLLEDLAGLDLVVSTGGTYLVERYNLGPRLFEYRLAEALGVPVVFWTQSLGPFRAPSVRRAVRDALARSPLVLLRDERSYSHVADLGVDGDHVHVVADCVFALADDADFAPRPAAPDGRLRVVVSVRQWPPRAALDDPEMERYAAAVAATVERLVRERDAEVTFLSTCQGIPEYWVDDSAVAVAIAERVAEDVRAHVAVDRDPHPPEALRERFRAVDVVLSTRMHAAILALGAGTPVVPIAYEPKTRELFRRLGLEEHVMDIEDATAETLPAAVDRFLDELPALRPRLAAGVRAQRAEAGRAEDLLRRHVLRTARPAV